MKALDGRPPREGGARRRFVRRAGARPRATSSRAGSRRATSRSPTRLSSGSCPGSSRSQAGSYAAAPARRGAARACRVRLSARRVACHRDPSRWDRLYRVLWRAATDGARILDDAADEDVLALGRHGGRGPARRPPRPRARPVPARRRGERRAIRRVPPPRAPDAAARRAVLRAPVRRRCAGRSGRPTRRRTGTGARCRSARASRAIPGASDEAEALWRAYYGSTFNPARVNPRLLRAHLPARHWDTLPEGRDIAALVRSSVAAGRGDDLAGRIRERRARPGDGLAGGPRRRGGALRRVPPLPRGDADRVRPRARDARIVLVGEQPGDEEDRAGGRSSGRRGGCSTRRSTGRALDAPGCTSRTQ